MRIAHVTDCYAPRVGGIETQVGQLAHRQAAAGHEVAVVTSTPARPPAVLADGPVPVHRLVGPHRGDRLRVVDPAALRRVGGLLDRLDADVVHVHSPVFSPLALAAAVASARTGRPTVVTVHSMWAYLTGTYRRLTTRTGLTDLPITWTAVSGVAARQVRAALGGVTPVTLLPNGVDPSFWRPLGGRQRAGAPGEPVVVAAVMRLSARKRPLALLRALRHTRDRLPADLPLQVVIRGDGPHRPLVERYARRHGMLGWVSLPGSGTPEQVRELLHAADLFVAPARLESFGIAALEARCAGVPVIGGADTGVADFIRDGVEGLLFRDDAGLAGAVARLAGSPDLRAAISAYGRAVPAPFGWGATLRAADAAYRRAAGARTRPVADVAEVTEVADVAAAAAG